MMNNISILVVLVFVVSILGCSNFESQKMQSVTKVDAARIASSFVDSSFPDFDKTNKQLVVEDVGEEWKVSYELPSDWLGGAPVVLVEKKSGRIVRSFRTQ